MSKVIIVDRCLKCPYATRWGCMLLGEELYYDKSILNNCPLPDLPERKEEMEYLATGYNKCLDDILEEQEV